MSAVTQLLLNTAHVLDRSIDAIDEEWLRRAWTIFSNCRSNCPTCPFSRSTVKFLAGHRVHEGFRSKRDGLVCGVLADADVVVIR
eukprot:684057-Pleurochrysis_carterae.AAC.1